MKYTLKPMIRDEALDIAGWHYEGQYSFYDFDSDLEDAREFLDFSNRPADKYFSVLDESGELAGFYEFNIRGDFVEIGLGMKPDMTGKGSGIQFLKAGLEFASSKFGKAIFRLSVAEFNVRAIKVYERAGFRKIRRFIHETNGGKYDFVEMELENLSDL